MSDNCMSCKWWKMINTGRPVEFISGFCQLNPPCDGDAYPRTKEDDKCSSWKSRATKIEPVACEGGKSSLTFEVLGLGRVPPSYKLSLTVTGVLCGVLQEREKQDEKWGEQNHNPLKWLAILGEEVGEANKAVLENDLANYREELLQVAAVAVAMVERLDRNKEVEHGGGRV